MPKVDLEAYWGPYPMKPNPDKSIRSYSVEFSEVVSDNYCLHRPYGPQNGPCLVCIYYDQMS